MEDLVEGAPLVKHKLVTSWYEFILNREKLYLHLKMLCENVNGEKLLCVFHTCRPIIVHVLRRGVFMIRGHVAYLARIVYMICLHYFEHYFFDVNPSGYNTYNTLGLINYWLEDNMPVKT